MTDTQAVRMVPDLLPCPFCGGAPDVSTYETESLWSHNIVNYTRVGCGECDVAFSTEPGYDLEAPDAWNRRAAAPSVQPGADREATGYCKPCNGPRAVSPCHKCGGKLTPAADGWEWPELPSIDRIRELAREVGYGVGIHGSLERDLDLIAIPWTADAVSPSELAAHIAAGLPGQVLDDVIQDKPSGRWSCNINPEGWFKMIDLSVMPPHDDLRPLTDDPAVAALCGSNYRAGVLAGWNAANHSDAAQGEREFARLRAVELGELAPIIERNKRRAILSALQPVAQKEEG